MSEVKPIQSVSVQTSIGALDDIESQFMAFTQEPAGDIAVDTRSFDDGDGSLSKLAKILNVPEADIENALVLIHM